jgi:ubiquinone biosynthesis protein UbiJ
MSLTSDLKQARNYVQALPRGAAIPDVDRHKYPITFAFASYVLDFESAKLKHGLHQFDVQRRLDSVHRLPAEIFRPWRSIAGLLILCGLLCTLATLSMAVKPLGDAFRELSKNQQMSSSSTAASPRSPVSGSDKVALIQKTMGEMADKARLAFGLSFLFISAAFGVMATVARMQRNRTYLIFEFANWAEQEYRSALPEQISIGEAASAFKENAQALGELTRSFNDLSLSLEAVKNFSATMTDVREAIVKALDRMPGEIQASMGLVTKDMVKNLERSMKDEVEAIKKILAIYGQQEVKIDEIRNCVTTVKEMTEKITHAATALEVVPRQLDAIDGSLKQHSSVAGQIETTAKRIEDSVLAFPSEELRGSAKALIEATAKIGHAHAQTADAVADLQSKISAVTTLDSELGKKLQTITTVSQQFLIAYDSLMSKMPDFNSGQKLVAESLERVAIQIGNEITKLAGKAEIATVSAHLKKLDLAFEDFRNRLRLVRNPSTTQVTPESPSGNFSGGPEEPLAPSKTAVVADAVQSPYQQIGTAASTIPDRELGSADQDRNFLMRDSYPPLYRAEALTDVYASTGTNGVAATAQSISTSDSAPTMPGTNHSVAFHGPEQDGEA